MNIDVNVLNPFLQAGVQVLQTAANLTVGIGKPALKPLEFDSNTEKVILGLTGKMTGIVVIAMSVNNACNIASAMMMGMPVAELDEMAISAISELGNMVMGTASTIMASNGIETDITPPMVERGGGQMEVKDYVNIAVPLMLNGSPLVEMNIAVK